MIGEQFGSIQNNGYVSRTLKSVQLGQKSTLEWIGEEFLVTNDKNDKAVEFPYAVVAHTKCVTYCV